MQAAVVFAGAREKYFALGLALAAGFGQIAASLSSLAHGQTSENARPRNPQGAEAEPKTVERRSRTKAVAD